MSEVLNCIMCIDDDEATNIYHKAIINRMDIINHHLVYDDAEEALDYLSQPIDTLILPDLILLDINMPRVNGWDFLDQYLSKGLDKKFEKTKIIVLTTSSNPIDQSKANSYLCVSGLENKILNEIKVRSILSEYFDYTFKD